jgi:hypothetical protein
MLEKRERATAQRSPVSQDLFLTLQNTSGLTPLGSGSFLFSAAFRRIGNPPRNALRRRKFLRKTAFHCRRMR